jgi:hypothetical protein
LYVSGVVNTIIYLFFETLWCGGEKAVYKAVELFARGWKWPSMTGNSKGIYELFSSERVRAWRKAKHLKSTAAECLALYPILLEFIRNHISPRWPNQCACFEAMCAMLTSMSNVNYGTVDPSALRSAINDFLSSVERAGWRAFIHPKFHWLVHMPQHLAAHGFWKGNAKRPRRTRLTPKILFRTIARCYTRFYATTSTI